MIRWSVRRFAGLLLAVVVLFAGSGCSEQADTASDSFASSRSDALTGEAVVPPGAVCTPLGAHAKHQFTACATCHACAGTLQFDAAGPAVIAGGPPPAFDATAKTCSSVACHAVPSGTFGYWFPGGDGEPAYNEVPYGGGGSTTPSWYTSGAAGCTGCHGNPPQNYTWHFGHPGGSQCELCHLDAVSTYDSVTRRIYATGLSTATNCGPNRDQPCASLHANGTLNVDPKWTKACLGCH